MLGDTIIDLTDSTYWGERQSNLGIPELTSPLSELLDAIIPFLEPYKNKKVIELGCSPGFVSSFICNKIKFIPFGIDLSPQAHLYTLNMRRIANTESKLIRSDFRDFKCKTKFNVVMSFGLIEHFENFEEIFSQHHRLCQKNGLIVITIPNFSYLQKIYHLVFDKRDLKKHNTKIMNLKSFQYAAEKKNHEILFLNYVGKINFWGLDTDDHSLIVFFKKVATSIIRFFTSLIFVRILPPNLKYYAPWIVYIGKKK